MILDWLTTTAAVYGFLGTGLLLVLWLFLNLKRELAALRARWDEQQRLLSTLVTSSEAEMERIRERLRDSEERCGVLVPPPATPTGMNLSKRTQAIRLLRLGERPEKIATSLGLGRHEVELLAKVQKTIAASVG